MTVEDVKRLKVAGVKCKQSLLFFTRYFFKAMHRRKFVIGGHHEIICQALERVLRGECRRLIINIAPRYGKTELAVKNFIAHGLALNPSAKFIHLSYSETLALDNSEGIKDLTTSDEYQQLFPGVHLKKDSKAKNKWYTTAGGGLYATAAAGQVTGFGAGKVDEEDEGEDLDAALEELHQLDQKGGFNGAIIIDDPIKPEDADSETSREKVNSRFDSTIRNRVNSRNTPIILIMQRLHPMDLAGYLQREEEQDEWEVISLPCLYFDKETGQKQALWPFKETVEELEAQEQANAVVFQRQKQQDPQPLEGLLFPPSELHFYEPGAVDLSAAEFFYMQMDAADEGGDFYAAPVFALVENLIYVPDVLFTKAGVEITEPDTVDLARKWKLNAASFEGNGGWVSMGKSIRGTLEQDLPDCDFRIIKNTTNKITRILAESGFIKRNMRFRGDYRDHPQYSAYIKNLTGFLKEGKNANDDAPDVTAGGAKYFRVNFSHLW